MAFVAKFSTPYANACFYNAILSRLPNEEETYKAKILKLIKRETEFKLCLSLFLNTVIPAFSTSWNHSIHYTKQSPLL